VFFATSRLPESEANSLHFPVKADGEWHDYVVPVGENRRWRGTITRLRLDPCNREGVEVALDWLRLE
jgi:hypothetical protein